MKKILDLRFVIGVFFTLVGLLLLGYSFWEADETGRSINRWCSIAFTIFGIIMILLSFVKDANDELLKEE
jgi:hypothetical protein